MNPAKALNTQLAKGLPCSASIAAITCLVAGIPCAFLGFPLAVKQDGFRLGLLSLSVQTPCLSE